MRASLRDILSAWVVIAVFGGGLAVLPNVSGPDDVASDGFGMFRVGGIAVPHNIGWQPIGRQPIGWQPFQATLGLPDEPRATQYADEDIPAWARGMAPSPARRGLAATGTVATGTAATGTDGLRICLAPPAATGTGATSGN
ncbi:MAG: hypothetical protein ACREER_07820 [Alphaproteobacteria bacterium]